MPQLDFPSPTLTVLVAPPLEPPAVRTVPATLAGLQACVGGFLELWAVVDHVALFCHEDGRCQGLPYNRRLWLDDGESSAFYGPLLLVGQDPATGASRSLTPGECRTWIHRLRAQGAREIRHTTRWQRYGARRRAPVRLVWDANGLTSASARTWARAVAASDWGALHRETALPLPGFPGWGWWFSCAGHAGAVAVSRRPVPLLRPFALEGAARDPHPAWHGATLYTFSEDADDAVLEAVFPALTAFWARQCGQSLAHRQALLRERLRRWHPAWLPTADAPADLDAAPPPPSYPPVA